MDLKEIREKAKKMLANFVDEIGLDGEAYVDTCNCPIAWGNPVFNSLGEFVSPGSKRLENILQESKYDERTKEILNQKGLILINRSYKIKRANQDLFITTIHETIHSNRNLLLWDAIRNNKNEKAYSSNNGKFDQNTSEYNFSYADASQEILKGSIDTSKELVDSYKNASSEELEDLEYPEGKKDGQMQHQQIADEALVELMSVLSYRLYRNKEKGEPTDIWKEIEGVIDDYESGDICAISEIILKHHDLELFNWMIDPITYSQGDIHYDFFGKYTKDDQDLVKELYESEDILGIIENNEINISDMKEVATSQTAIEELANSYRDVKNAQSRENIESERK